MGSLPIKYTSCKQYTSELNLKDTNVFFTPLLYRAALLRNDVNRFKRISQVFNGMNIPQNGVWNDVKLVLTNDGVHNDVKLLGCASQIFKDVKLWKRVTRTQKWRNTMQRYKDAVDTTLNYVNVYWALVRKDVKQWSMGSVSLQWRISKLSTETQTISSSSLPYLLLDTFYLRMTRYML